MPTPTMDLNLHAPCILNFPQVNQDETGLAFRNNERRVSRRRPPLNISNGATKSEKSSDSRDGVRRRRREKGQRRRRRRKSCYDHGVHSSKSTQTANPEKEDCVPAPSSMTVASFGDASCSTMSLDSTDILSAWLKRRRRRNRNGELDSHSVVTGCEPPAFLLPLTHMEKGKLPEDMNFETNDDASQIDSTSATESSTSCQIEDEQAEEDSIQEEHGTADAGAGVVYNVNHNNDDSQRSEDSSKVVPEAGLDEIDSLESHIDGNNMGGKDSNQCIGGVDKILDDRCAAKGDSIHSDVCTKLENKESIDDDNLVVQENRFIENSCTHDIGDINHGHNDSKESISDDNRSIRGEDVTETASETSIVGNDDSPLCSQRNDSAAIIMEASTNYRSEEEPCVVLEEVENGLDSFSCPSGELSSSSSQSSVSSLSSVATASIKENLSVCNSKHDSTLATILITGSSDADTTDTSKSSLSLHDSDVREGDTKKLINLRSQKSRSLVSRGWHEVTYVDENTELAVVQPEERKMFAKFVIDNHLELRGGFGETDDTSSCSQDDDDRHYRNLLNPSEFVKGKYWALKCTKTGEILSTIGVHPSTDSDVNEGGQLALSGFCVPRRWYGEGYGDLLLNTVLQHISAGRQQEFGLVILR